MITKFVIPTPMAGAIICGLGCRFINWLPGGMGREIHTSSIGSLLSVVVSGYHITF